MVMVDLTTMRRGDTREPLFHRESRPGNTWVRIITAQAIAAIRRTAPPHVIAESLWPSDRTVFEVLHRAASVPAMTTVAGWAAELAHKVVQDAVEALMSAASSAQIMKQGLVFDWDGAGAISVPGFVAGPGNASFVGEGQPIPVRQLASAAALLNPHKLATIAVLTREMLESSNAEAAVGDAIIQSCAAAMDVAFFDANPEDATRSAGMKYNIAASTPSAATDFWQAAFEDVAALINAIGPVAGNGPYIIVGSPGRTVAMGLRFNIDPSVARSIAFYGSSAMGNDLAAIAPRALVTAAAPTADVEAAAAGTLVMDTVPGAAGTMGTEKSMFQTNSVALKVRWPVSWALRDPRGYAWMTPNWKPG
jgi:hypothetical protein